MRRLPLFYGTFAVLALTFAAPSSSHAQQEVMLQHLAPEGMSGADHAALDAHENELVESAEVYGYNLSVEAGNWNYGQTVCPAMPETIMLHYWRQFPDGTQSQFTALIPRQSGRARIVPVLYRNATPFTPASNDPRNFVLFNQLVPLPIASQGTSADGNWVELGMCYAEMTGAFFGDLSAEGLRQTPPAVAHVDTQYNVIHVSLGSSEANGAYRYWNIAINKEGRVMTATSERYPTQVTKVVPQSPPPSEPELAPAAISTSATAPLPQPTPEPVAGPVAASVQPMEAGAAASANAPAEVAPAKITVPEQPSAQQKETHSKQPVWRVVPPAPAPVWRVIPPALQPRAKTVPGATGAENQPAAQPQPPQ